MSQSHDRGAIEDLGRWREFSAGMWAWIFHKITGWILIGYLFVHIAVLSTSIPAAEGIEATLGDETVDIYTAVIQGLESLYIVRILELGLIAAVVFHILNGIRLLLLDVGIGAAYQDKTFYAALIATGLSVIASVPVLLGGGL